MIEIALKMLTGERAKYLALVFGVAFATLLMTQQVSIFIGLMTRTAAQVLDVRDADVWVMDPRVRYVDEVEPLRDVDLVRVRGVEGVEWAAPLFKGLAILRTPGGISNQISLVGVDDATLAGAPRTYVEGSVDAFSTPGAILLDKQGAALIWPDGRPPIGTIAEIGDRRVTLGAIVDASATFITFPVAYMSYSDALAVTSGGPNRMSFVLVRTREGEDPKAVAKRITERTGLQALTWDAFAWRSVQYYLTRTGIPVNFGITVFLGFLVGAAITAQTFNLFIVENIRQFGALKAIGVTNGQILRMVLAQSATVGFIGFGLGVGTCAALFAILGQRTSAFEGFVLHWQVVAGAGAVVVLIMILSCVFSLKRVFTVDPAVVFRG